MYVSFYCMFPLFLSHVFFFHYSVLRVRFYNKIIIIIKFYTLVTHSIIRKCGKFHYIIYIITLLLVMAT